MFRKIPIFLLAFVFCAATLRAGVLDIRGGVGRSAANFDKLNDQAKAAGGDGVDANDFQTYNADIFINLPMIPIGFGVRNEWFNLNQGSGGNEVDLKATNLSLLADWRIINLHNFYLGPIVAVGHPSAKVNFKSGTVTIDKHINGNDVSYAGALEAGVYLGPLLIGAETGYQNIKFQGDTDQGTTAKFDASGVYGKIMAGLTFF